MASYRIGSNDFFTGADLKADAVTLNSQVTAISRVIQDIPQNEDPLGKDLELSWVGFESQWDFYFQNTYQNSSGFEDFLTALNDGNRDQLIQYESRFADLHDQIKAKGVDSAAVNVAVSLGAPDTVTHLIADIDAAAKKLLPFGLGLGAFLIIALVVWYIVIPRLAT